MELKNENLKENETNNDVEVKENETIDVVEVIESENNLPIEKQEHNYLITKNIQTTVEDKKLLFNLNDHVDFKLNDMEGKVIKVTNIVIKTYEKVDKETGEVTKSIATILLDDTNTSYATASKLFAMRVQELWEIFGDEIKNGVEIRITKTQYKDSKNKKLGFELL